MEPGLTPTGKEVTEQLNQIGMRLEPPILVYTHAASSPDHNIDDLSFFRPLSTAVKKVRRGERSFRRLEGQGIEWHREHYLKGAVLGDIVNKMRRSISEACVQTMHTMYASKSVCLCAHSPFHGLMRTW
jgi:hypothetical protein